MSDIYCIFNSDTNVFQCALVQGAEPDGQFDVRGDERWLQHTSQLNNLFRSQYLRFISFFGDKPSKKFLRCT